MRNLMKLLGILLITIISVFAFDCIFCNGTGFEVKTCYMCNGQGGTWCYDQFSPCFKCKGAGVIYERCLICKSRRNCN
jgi:DnaJ-class molecular chaperone